MESNKVGLGIDITKKLADYYYNVGLNYARNNGISAAIGKLLCSITLSKENVDALNLLGLCFYRVGEFKKAKYFWNESLLLNNAENPVSQYLTRLEEENTALNNIILKIQPLITGKKYKKALRTIKKVNDNINNVKLSNYIGVLHMLSKKEKRANEYWKKSLKIDNTNRQALNYITME